MMEGQELVRVGRWRERGWDGGWEVVEGYAMRESDRRQSCMEWSG